MSGYVADNLSASDFNKAKLEDAAHDARTCIECDDLYSDLQDVAALFEGLLKSRETALVGELLQSLFEAKVMRMAYLDANMELPDEAKWPDDVGADIRAKWRAQNEARIQKRKEQA